MLDIPPISYMTQIATSTVVRDNYPAMVLVFYSLFCNAMGTELGWDMGFGKLIVEGEDQGFQTRTVHWTVKERDSRFLRSNRGRIGIKPWWCHN